MDKWVQTFLLGISPKLHEIAWLELELTPFDVAIQYFSLVNLPSPAID